MILGILTAEMLADRHYPVEAWACDGLELRADGLPVDVILPALRDFFIEKKERAFKGPVFFTLRLQRDGGAWENGNAAVREAVWQSILESAHLPDFFDLEIQEAASLSDKLPEWRALGVKVVLSHHDFVGEGFAEWERLLDSMRGIKPDAVKFAVTVQSSHEAASLLDFARQVSAEFPLSCVLAMGEIGKATRIASPLLGCPVTYAFLGQGSVAPGQLSAGTLRRCFEKKEGRPAPSAAGKDWIDWAGKTLKDVNG